MILWMVKICCAVVTLVAVVFAIYRIGPWYETRYWPVVSKMQLIRLERFGDRSAHAEFTFEKLRPCQFAGINWFHRSTQDSFLVRVTAFPTQDIAAVTTPNRPLGLQHSGIWVVELPPEEIVDASLVLLYHKCHPFWLTTTEFYP